MRYLRSLASLVLVLVISPAAADLEASSAWARASTPGATSGAIYLTLTNTGTEDLVVKQVETDLARMAMIHESQLRDGMMAMTHRDELVVPAGGSTVFAPGGLHIMLMGLREPLVQGGAVALTLRTATGDAVVVEALVGSIGQMAPPD